jgi:hypothetical protein
MTNAPRKSDTTTPMRPRSSAGEARDDRPGGYAPPPDGGDGMGCHAGAAEMEKPRPAWPASRRSWTNTPRTIRKGPHDKPQSMCPAFGSLRVGLRMRRTATVLSGSACCVYGLTFVAFLRRPPHGRLRAVQFRDPGDRQAVRRHPRRRARDGRPGQTTTPSWSPISAFRPRRVCLCGCCRMRSTACASSASTCRASACRPMPRPRTSSPGRCSTMPAGGRAGPRSGPCLG